MTQTNSQKQQHKGNNMPELTHVSEVQVQFLNQLLYKQTPQQPEGCSAGRFRAMLKWAWARLNETK